MEVISISNYTTPVSAGNPFFRLFFTNRKRGPLPQKRIFLPEESFKSFETIQNYVSFILTPACKRSILGVTGKINQPVTC